MTQLRFWRLFALIFWVLFYASDVVPWCFDHLGPTWGVVGAAAYALIGVAMLGVAMASNKRKDQARAGERVDVLRDLAIETQRQLGDRYNVTVINDRIVAERKPAGDQQQHATTTDDYR